jgi:hypothetical protein
MMLRYGVVALVGCFYAAASVWLVRSEAQAYRKAIGHARAVNNVAALPAADEKAEAEKLTVADASTKPVPSRLDQPTAKTDPASDTPLKPIVADEKPRTAAPPVQIAATPPIASAAPSLASASVTVTRGAPRLEDRDPFWNQPFLTKVWNLDHFSAQDENVLGEELHNLIIQLNPLDNGSGRQRVIEATRQLVELRSRKDIEYKFTILNSDIPNAFSHPGGYIYVSTGLLDMIADDEDYLLEFVIGHEIAHLELQHALQCLGDRSVREFKDGTLQKLYFLILPHAFPKELEFAADYADYQRMKRLGRTDHDCLAFLRKLETYAKANGFADGQGKLEDLHREGISKQGAASAISPIENHLRAHTAAWERLSQLKQFRDHAPKATK